MDLVINSENAHLGLSQSEQVAKTIAYKAGRVVDEGRRDHEPGAAGGLGFGRRPPARQAVRRPDHEPPRRLSAQIQQAITDGRLPADYPPVPPPPERLTEALEIMRKVREEGMAPVDMELALARMGTTPGQVGADMGSYLEAMEKMIPDEIRADRFPGSA